MKIRRIDEMVGTERRPAKVRRGGPPCLRAVALRRASVAAQSGSPCLPQAGTEELSHCPSVIPAKAGIHSFLTWIPICTGMTGSDAKHGGIIEFFF
jgi:hypothetical protein